ncbi:MAG: hypothetical protein DA443_03590 [Bacteroidetes bacterium]|nr:MAG: hypothetical protein DA443_03590 [Bacteroidota bacterium]
MAFESFPESFPESQWILYLQNGFARVDWLLGVIVVVIVQIVTFFEGSNSDCHSWIAFLNSRVCPKHRHQTEKTKR